MNIKCPKCNSSLKEIKISQVILDKCDKCKGLWFDDKELFEVLNQHNLNEDEIKSNESSKPNCPSVNNCPKCVKPLKKIHSFSIAGLEIDICSTCNGIWLDYGEFEEIKQNQIDSQLQKINWKYPSQHGQAVATYELINNIKTSAFNKKINKNINKSKKLLQILINGKER